MSLNGGSRTRGAASWQRIHDGILDAVLRHRIEPGTKLVEDDIAEVYGVSRTVVRAALQVLARGGVVVLQRNKGASIAHPSPDEAREIFQARALIEPEIAARAARRTTPADAAALMATIDAEHHAFHADNPREAVFHSADFHRRVAALADHGVLAEILNGLLSRSSLVVSLYWRRPATLCDNDAHLALSDALSRGDGDGAARIMREHVEALLADLDLSPPRRPASDLSAVLLAGPVQAA